MECGVESLLSVKMGKTRHISKIADMVGVGERADREKTSLSDSSGWEGRLPVASVEWNLSNVVFNMHDKMLIQDGFHLV